MEDSFYRPTGDPSRFESTPHTQGPWGAGLQHAGPPSALLARAIEGLPSTLSGEPHLARLTVDILGAVPVEELTVTAAVLRPGRSVELVEASALRPAAGPVLTARGWRIRRTTLDLPRPAPAATEPAPMRPAAATHVRRPGVADRLPRRGRVAVHLRALREARAGLRLGAAAGAAGGRRGMLSPCSGWWRWPTRATG